MLTTFLYLNFLSCPVQRPCLFVGYPTLDIKMFLLSKTSSNLFEAYLSPNDPHLILVNMAEIKFRCGSHGSLMPHMDTDAQD